MLGSFRCSAQRGDTVLSVVGPTSFEQLDSDPSGDCDLGKTGCGAGESARTMFTLVKSHSQTVCVEQEKNSKTI